MDRAVAPLGVSAPRRTAPWPSEILGGCLGAVVMLAVLLTLGLLSHAPLGARGAGMGLTAAFVAMAVGGLVVTWLGRSPLPVGGPSSATALIFAGLIAQLIADPRAGMPGVLAASGCAVMLMGALQVAIARLGLGRVAQFVPQPVLAGFMNGVAVLIVVAQVPALLGLPDDAPLGATGLGAAPVQPGALALGLAVAAGTFAIARRWPRSHAQLVGLLAGAAVFAGLGAIEPGWRLGEVVGELSAHLPRPDLPLRLGDAPTLAFVWGHAGEVLTTAALLAVIGSLESVLNLLAIEAQLEARHDLDHELHVLGVANAVVGLFGGLPVVMLRARAQATLRAGGLGWRASLAGSLAFAAMYLLLGPLLAGLPKPVLAGIMLTVAAGLADHWTRQLLRQWRSGERSAETWTSLAIVAVVCGVTVWQGFAVGVAVGVVIAVGVFVQAMNRSLVRARFPAAAQPSRRVYPTRQEQHLQSARGRIEVIELEGALFFGSAERLLREAQVLRPDVRAVVLDLRGVSTLDESGAVLLERLSSELKRRRVDLLLAGVTERNAHGRRLRAFGCFRATPRDDWYADTDRAVEAAEGRLLAEAGLALVDLAVPLATCTLMRGLDDGQRARVEAHLERRELARGEALFLEGEAGDRLYLLTRGSITVLSGDGPPDERQRFISFSAGGMLGETAMLDGVGRSAGAWADDAAEVHALSLRSLDALQAQDPDLAARLYRNIALHLSQRLRSATAARHVVAR